jgi:hypothetical protein
MNCYRCLQPMIQLGIERGRAVWHCVFCEINIKESQSVTTQLSKALNVYDPDNTWEKVD